MQAPIMQKVVFVSASREQGLPEQAQEQARVRERGQRRGGGTKTHEGKESDQGSKQ